MTWTTRNAVNNKPVVRTRQAATARTHLLRMKKTAAHKTMQNGSVVESTSNHHVVGVASASPQSPPAARLAVVARASASSATTRVPLNPFAPGSKYTVEGVVMYYVKLLAGLGTLLAADSALKKAVLSAGITFPSPLIGMFLVIGVLCLLSAANQQKAVDAVMEAISPALNWISRWLPLFYVPSLVILPIAVKSLNPAALTKVSLIVALGMPFSLLVTAFLVTRIRKLANTTAQPVTPAPPLAPFTEQHAVAWGSIGFLSGIVACFAAQGTALAANASAVATLAFTVLGLLIGSDPHPSMKKYMPHPVITTSLVANAGVALVGMLNGVGYMGTLKAYLTKGAAGAAWGAGDWLMSFLGIVVISFGFRIYGQRALLRRHLMEILGSAAGSAIISLAATCLAGRLLGLGPDLTTAVAPRSVTVALAMPIATQLGAPAELIPICATAVVLTGLIGAALAQKILDLAGFKNDPITRGLSVAAAAHGLGTAALARAEPEALPFCALAYGLMGVAASTWVAIPVVRSMLMWLAGVPA
ncbi:hypothetical protein PPROV_000862100 [Pycnococcus provasolii]|uniref:LrgB-like protein n=1 Tax=Pycnococcus provasolii TaxID=41880 RepID=A0A830HQS9_9CHLO|nr:hypothetical protein PPROV_000862100 [Pycnococcus provasolii]